MRYCIYCKKPMYTSNESIWIGKSNFDIHLKCKKKYIIKKQEEENMNKIKCKCGTKLQEIKCLRAVLERILRVMDEGLFVDYQMEKFGRINYKGENVKEDAK